MTQTTFSYQLPATSPLDRALAATDFSAGGRATLPALSSLPSGPLARRLVTAEFNEQTRAALASTALDNTAALSAMATHLSTVAPYGHHCYYAIVEAYAIGAIHAIGRA